MLTDVFLGIIGSFGSEKTGCLVHVGMETCHVTPPEGRVKWLRLGMSGDAFAALYRLTSGKVKVVACNRKYP